MPACGVGHVISRKDELAGSTPAVGSRFETSGDDGASEPARFGSVYSGVRHPGLRPFLGCSAVGARLVGDEEVARSIRVSPTITF